MFDLNGLKQALASRRWSQAEQIAAELESRGRRYEAGVGRLVLAIRFHDAGLVREVEHGYGDELRRTLEAHRLLARGLYWTAGLAAAAAELEAVCRHAPGHGQSPNGDDLALAAMGRLACDRIQTAFCAEYPSDIDFLPEHLHPVVPGTVNGHGQEYLLVDTGASTTLLSADYCRRKGIPLLESYPSTAYDGVGNSVATYPAFVEKLQIGNAVLGNVITRAAKFPDNLRVAGILSPLDTLRNFPVEFDLSAGRLRLHSPNALQGVEWCAGEECHDARLIWNNGNIFVEADMGMAGAVLLNFDTGAGANMVTPEFARRNSIEFKMENPVTSFGFGGTVSAYAGFEAPLAVGNSSPVNSRFLITPRFAEPAGLDPLDCDGYLGLSWMTGRRMLFPRGGQTVRFTATHPVNG